MIIDRKFMVFFLLMINDRKITMFLLDRHDNRHTDRTARGRERTKELQPKLQKEKVCFVSQDDNETSYIYQVTMAIIALTNFSI